MTSPYEQHEIVIPDPTVLQHEDPQAYAVFLLELVTLMDVTQNVSRSRLLYNGHSFRRHGDILHTDYVYHVAYGYLDAEPGEINLFAEYVPGLTFFLRSQFDTDPLGDVDDTVTVQLGEKVILLQPEFERLKPFIPPSRLLETIMLTTDLAYAMTQKFNAQTQEKLNSLLYPLPR